MKYALHLVALLTVLVAVYPQVASAVDDLGQSIDFKGDWETGQFTGAGNWQYQETPGKSYSQNLVTDNVRQGKYAARFEVRNELVNNGERSEVSGASAPNGSADYSENIPGTVYFYAFSSKLNSPWNPGKSWNIILQMHGPWDGLYSGASPSFAFNADTEYSMTINGGNKEVESRYRNKRYNFNSIVSDGGKIDLDVWDDYVVEIKWDIEKRGYVKVWRRKHGLGEKEFQLVANVQNETTLMYDNSLKVNGNGSGGVTKSKHYWKSGLYRGFAGDVTEPTVVYLDGFTRARSFEDAAYGAFNDTPDTVEDVSPKEDTKETSDITESDSSVEENDSSTTANENTTTEDIEDKSSSSDNHEDSEEEEETVEESASDPDTTTPTLVDSETARRVELKKQIIQLLTQLVNLLKLKLQSA